MIEVRGIAYIRHKDCIECHIIIRAPASGIYQTFRVFRDRVFSKDELFAFLREKCKVSERDVILSNAVEGLFK